MDIENLEKLKEALYRKGFGEELNAELEKQMQSGKPEFTLEHSTKIGDDQAAYRLHFRRDDDPQKDRVYFNSYDAAITSAGGETKEHNFPADKLITAMEAYRMLKHGELVAVNKTLFNKGGQQYNTWLSIDVNGKKDDYGNYPVLSYHENYYSRQPFDVREELKNLPVPVKELENAEKLDNIEKLLKKAFLIPVALMVDGVQTTGTLAVNPKAGRIDVYDADMGLLEGKKQDQKDSVSQSNETEQKQDELKKKPWEQRQQRVNWKQEKSPHKGISR